MKTVKLKTIVVEPEKGAAIHDVMCETIELSARERADVSFTFNGRSYTVEFCLLLNCVRQAPDEA